jgi:hypothetical protein
MMSLGMGEPWASDEPWAAISQRARDGHKGSLVAQEKLKWAQCSSIGRSWKAMFASWYCLLKLRYLVKVGVRWLSKAATPTCSEQRLTPYLSGLALGARISNSSHPLLFAFVTTCTLRHYLYTFSSAT